ncbi:MAG: hypothetical protein ACKOAM_06660 [Chakrabartia sp.]
MNRESAPVIALIGADGAGKSTLIKDLLAHVQKYGPAEAGYLGLGSGPLGRKIGSLPLIGPTLERVLTKKAQQARDPNGAIPGLLTAIVLYRYSVKRKRRFDYMAELCKRGITVLTDRYPQAEIPGFYDGPGLSAARTASPIIAWLAKRELQLYQKMADARPTLVLRLNIDLPTALQRAGDHEPDLLAQKIAATPRLTFNGAHVVDIDATQSYAAVLADAKKAIDERLGL